MATMSRRAWGAALTGFALGGFFDGIVLHQVLQWHHLLSAVDTPALADLRMQVLADGLFHAAMYVVAVAGLALLLSRRATVPADPPGLLAGDLLLGFAAWHTTDAVLSHWVLGLHRIRMDVAVPLAWDLAWLAAFGLLPALLGAWLLRRGRRRPGPGGGPGRGAGVDPSPGRTEAPGRPAGPTAREGRPSGGAWIAALAVVTTAAALASAVPVAGGGVDTGQAIVLRAPGVTPAEALARLADADARLVWLDGRASVFVVQADPRRPLPGWRDGVWTVPGRLAATACAGFLRAPGG